MAKPFSIICFMVCFVALTNIAQANDSLDACLTTHNSCTQSCLDEKDTKGSQAACIAQCAVQEAQCAGKIGLKTGEPFIRDKVEELEGFIERFMKDFLPENQPKDTIDQKNTTQT